MWLFGLSAIAWLAFFIVWQVLHLLGMHGGMEHAANPPIGPWQAIGGSVALALVSSAFADGSPTEEANSMLEAIISRVRKGEDG